MSARSDIGKLIAANTETCCKRPMVSTISEMSLWKFELKIINCLMLERHQCENVSLISSPLEILMQVSK